MEVRLDVFESGFQAPPFAVQLGHACSRCRLPGPIRQDRQQCLPVSGRLQASGYTAPATFVLEHGYCRSLYISDPNGMLLEFTLDAPDAERIAAERQADALPTLRRWLGGDHTSNNVYR